MKAVVLSLAVILSYALLILAANDTETTSVETADNSSTTVTTMAPQSTTSGTSGHLITLPSAMIAGVAYILHQFF